MVIPHSRAPSHSTRPFAGPCSPCVTSADLQNTPVCTRLPYRPPAGLIAGASEFITMHMLWRGSNPVRLQGLGLDICPVMSLSAGTHKHTAGVSFGPYMSLPTSDILDKCIGMDPFFLVERKRAPKRYRGAVQSRTSQGIIYQLFALNCPP